MDYSVELFLEIIESIPGIVFIRNEYSDGVHMRVYQGLKSKSVHIFYDSDEDLSCHVGKGYLEQLGLTELIPRIFPNSADEPSMKTAIEGYLVEKGEIPG